MIPEQETIVEVDEASAFGHAVEIVVVEQQARVFLGLFEEPCYEAFCDVVFDGSDGTESGVHVGVAFPVALFGVTGFVNEIDAQFPLVTVGVDDLNFEFGHPSVCGLAFFIFEDDAGAGLLEGSDDGLRWQFDLGLGCHIWAPWLVGWTLD